MTPWIEAKNRDVLFKECVIGFLGGNKPQVEDKFCEACKAAGRDNCGTCDRSISVGQKT